MEAWNAERAHELIQDRIGQAGAALPILHALQEAFGCVPEVAVPMIADALNVTRAEVHGIVTFYHDFRRVPPGRHVLKLCRAEACQAMGARDIEAHLKTQRKADWHDTHGGVTLEPVYCLGLCACAPAALWDGRPVGRLTPARLDALLDEAGAEP